MRSLSLVSILAAAGCSMGGAKKSYVASPEMTGGMPSPGYMIAEEAQPQAVNTEDYTDYGKNPEKDVFQMWTKNWVDEQGMIEAELGPWPGMDIAHVPFEQALFYACRDADALIRLRPLLLAMRERVRDYPQEEWLVA